MLTDAELSQMRADIALLMPDTCNILTSTYASDGAGGFSETWGTVTANVPCRVDYKTGSEQITGGALVPYQRAVISFGYSVVITTQNRLEVGTNVFSVKSANAGQSWKAVTRVEAELVP